MASRSTEFGFNRVAAYCLLFAGGSALASVVRHAGGIPVEITVLTSAYGVLALATGLLLRRGSRLAPWGFALCCASFVALLAVAPGVRRPVLIPVVVALFIGLALMHRLLAYLHRARVSAGSPPSAG
jgi:hypothetical protein